MIREEDVREAIAEMQGQKNPNANTCIKLAAYYIIQDHLKKPEQTQPTYSEMNSYYNKESNVVEYQGDSEFAKAINGRTPDKIWPVVDELITTIQVIHPRLYNGFMGKLRES